MILIQHDNCFIHIFYEIRLFQNLVDLVRIIIARLYKTLNTGAAQALVSDLQPPSNSLGGKLSELFFYQAFIDLKSLYFFGRYPQWVEARISRVSSSCLSSSAELTS